MGESATCDDDCTLAECGDGVVNETAGEECDDGNTVGGDGCEATCLLPPAALFNGTYFYQAFAGNFPAFTGYSWWGDVVADGVNQITGGTLGWNDGAGGISSGPVPALSYTVNAARRMTWPVGGPFNVQGGIAIDGSVATLSSIGATGWPGLSILVRRGGTFDLGSLNGTYSLSGLLSDVSGDFAIWGTVVFDGIGGANESFMVNRNGTQAGPFDTAQSYTVAADGTTTYTSAPANVPIQGGILMGGDLVVLTGTTVVGPPSLIILIRQSAAASASTLSGNYHIGAFVFDVGAPPPYFSSFTGTASSDGVNTLTTNVGGTINVDGVVGPWPPSVTNDAYTVLPDGTLTMTTAGTTLVGSVSPTGAYAAVAGGMTAGSIPQLWFMVR
jgi:cysteine-rich repeat protein